MNKAVLFLVFIFGYSLLFAQTIPYATQQPKWVFPVYAKDATGKRDTIYLGYHPDASDVCGDEIQFGEIWFPGENDFSLSTYFWIDPIDSVLKANIRDTLENKLYYDCGYPITLSNVVLPVTFYWDISLLRSDSLPFPDQDPAPRAQLHIGFDINSVVDEPGTNCNYQEPIVATDSINSCCYQCFIKDSLRLLDIFGDTNPQTFALNFEIIPWTGDGLLSIFENNQREIKVFPNPTSDKINISGLTNHENLIMVMDIRYRKLNSFYKNDGSDIIIDVSSLDSGVYFIRIENSKSMSMIKFIKN